MDATTEISQLIADLGLSLDQAIAIAKEAGVRGSSIQTDERLWTTRPKDVQIMLYALRARKAAADKAAAKADPSKVTWTKLAGEWVLRGQGLTPGQIVTVTKASGATSEEIVGRIVGERDGWQLATRGRVQTHRDYDEAAKARAAGARLGINGEIWED